MSSTATRSRHAHRSHLLERISQPATSRVDRQAAVIRGVKVLGRKSSNDREYLPETIRRAVPLYEGAPVRVNHPDRPDDQRKAEDTFGWLRNVRVGPSGDLYADLHYLKSHPMAERICESAERNSRLIGLSHNAEGEVERRGDRLVVTAIHEVRSVDLVADPATTTGLFESRQPARQANQRHFRNGSRTNKMAYTLKEWLDRSKLLRPARARIARLFEGGYMSPDMPMSEADEDEVPPGGDTEPVSAAPMTDADPADMEPEDALKAGFRAAMIAVLDDGTLDVKSKGARLKKLLQALDDLTAAGVEVPEAHEEPDGDEPDEDELTEGEMVGAVADPGVKPFKEGNCAPPKKGSVTESRELRQLRAERAARQLCDAEGVVPSQSLLEALAALADEPRRRALLEEVKGGRLARPGRAARTAEEMTEQGRRHAPGRGAAAAADDVQSGEELARRLLS